MPRGARDPVGSRAKRAPRGRQEGAKRAPRGRQEGGTDLGMTDGPRPLGPSAARPLGRSVACHNVTCHVPRAACHLPLVATHCPPRPGTDACWSTLLSRACSRRLVKPNQTAPPPAAPPPAAPPSAAVGSKRTAGATDAGSSASATAADGAAALASGGGREVDLRRELLRRLSPADGAFPSAEGAEEAACPLGAGAALKRARRFERDACGLAAASVGSGQANNSDMLEALRQETWYAPPPYTWSSMEFGLSTDHGAAGRNFADGGGWGRCERLCPDAEAHERLHIAPNVNPHEQPISALSNRPEAFLVTMFHRNDAARVWQPSDIRTISALAASVEHLMTVVLDRPMPDHLPFIHRASFIRDRLRQARQELTMQVRPALL